MSQTPRSLGKPKHEVEQLLIAVRESCKTKEKVWSYRRRIPVDSGQRKRSTAGEKASGAVAFVFSRAHRECGESSECNRVRGHTHSPHDGSFQLTNSWFDARKTRVPSQSLSKTRARNIARVTIRLGIGSVATNMLRSGRTPRLYQGHCVHLAAPRVREGSARARKAHGLRREARLGPPRSSER